jgi:hypothetical protein
LQVLQEKALTAKLAYVQEMCGAVAVELNLPKPRTHYATADVKAYNPEQLHSIFEPDQKGYLALFTAEWLRVGCCTFNRRVVTGFVVDPRHLPGCFFFSSSLLLLLLLLLYLFLIFIIVSLYLFTAELTGLQRAGNHRSQFGETKHQEARVGALQHFHTTG